MATLGRLMSLLSPFDVVIWMTDGWPLYESRLKGKLHVISKRYTQRIERHNLNLRQHLARLGRKSLAGEKSVELHDKVIGHYLNIKASANTRAKFAASVAGTMILPTPACAARCRLDSSSPRNGGKSK